MIEVGTDYKISAHCKQRYAERIMDKDTANDVNRFIAENEEKIKTDIGKMITYGELIFTGRKSQTDMKGGLLNVYVKDCWVILVDDVAGVVVTLYKIDLGLGDEFNKMYVGKMLEKIREKRAELDDAQMSVAAESSTYKQLIVDAEDQIKEYKAMIKNLENLCDGYKTVINNNKVRVTKANRELADVVNQLVGKKEF